LKAGKNQTKSVAARTVQRLEREGLEYLFFGIFDISGQIREREISRRYLASIRNLALHQVAGGFADFHNSFEFIKENHCPTVEIAAGEVLNQRQLRFPVSELRRRKTMRRQADNPNVSRQQDHVPRSRTVEEKELDRIADEAAERAGKEEQRYDEEHSIFTK
jgi:hypothetical protein